LRLKEIDLHKKINTTINQKNELNNEIDIINKDNSIMLDTLEVTKRDM